ncbi:hypothetical protein NKDENANG_01457 [Candidatus Entotheonellaceae bacterium PAL068K]
MSHQQGLHGATLQRLYNVLLQMLRPVADVCMQAPVTFKDGSVLVPDIIICQPDSHDGASTYPDVWQILLLIEVADTSLAHDWTHQAKVYAVHGIPIYWIVNLEARRVDVLTNPDAIAGRYDRHAPVYAGESLPLPGAQVLAVADIFPSS